MAVNSNIGKLNAAIRAGLKANYNTYYGPIIHPHDTNDYSNKIVRDAFQNTDDGKSFVWGFHKWGDSNFKVSE